MDEWRATDHMAIISKIVYVAYENGSAAASANGEHEVRDGDDE
jgi:hypothetical protein